MGDVGVGLRGVYNNKNKYINTDWRLKTRKIGREQRRERDASNSLSTSTHMHILFMHNYSVYNNIHYYVECKN